MRGHDAPITESETDLDGVADAELIDLDDERGIAGDCPEGFHERERTTFLNLASAEVVRRRAGEALDRQRVVQVARRVATGKTAGMTDDQVVRWLAENPRRQTTIAGHLHERLDADAVNVLNAIRRAVRLPPGRLLQLYDAQNRPKLDGFYRGTRGTGQARFAQHKLSRNPATLRAAGAKLSGSPVIKRQTELVVPRGIGAVARPAAGMLGVRETGHSLADVHGMMKRAANPSRALEVGARAAKGLTVRGAVGAGLVGAGVSAATGAVAVARHTKTVEEASADVAWAAGEAAMSSAAAAAVAVAVAPVVATSGGALAASTVAGTTALAAGVTVLLPVAISLGVAAGVGYGVRRVRGALAGRRRALAQADGAAAVAASEPTPDEEDAAVPGDAEDAQR